MSLFDGKTPREFLSLHIGYYMRKRRIKSGAELAQRFGVPEYAIHHLTGGVGGPCPSDEHVLRVCDGLDLQRKDREQINQMYSRQGKKSFLAAGTTTADAT